MAKLSKRDIREGLDTIPMDTLLSPQGKKIQLTTKQRDFAKNVALGKTKTQSYREAYKTKAKPSSVSVNACKLASDTRVQLMIEAYKEAIEASKYRTPAQLRELVIHQLTIHALSEENSARDRLSAIKMLGNVAEIGAFVERKESLVIHESSKVKADLVARLKDIVGGEIREATDEGEELLQALSHSKNTSRDTHAHALPPNVEIVGAKHIHNIPDSQSPSESEDPPISNEDPIPTPPPSTMGDTPVSEEEPMDLSGSCKNTDLQDVDFVEKKNEV